MRSLSVALLTIAALLPSPHLRADQVPCSCLQELWVDYPGPYDLYFSLNHITSCSDEGQEGLWYGAPTNFSFPQDCEENQCEEYQGPENRLAASFPGHGQELVGTKAWDVFRTGLESAARKMPGLEFGAPSYYVIPHKSLPVQLKATRDIVVMAIPVSVHIKESRFDGRNYYLCVQISSAEGVQLSQATFEGTRTGRGRQFRIKIRPQNGDARLGLVWLR